MLAHWTIAVLLLLLLEAAGGGAQSGDGDLDSEPGLSCSSHISTRENSLTCRLSARSGGEDDEDAGAQTIAEMTVCQDSWSGTSRKQKCWSSPGDTFVSEHLSVLSTVNVTVHQSGGRRVSASFPLDKIVKPRSPQICNVTWEPWLSRIVVYFQIPYSKDYLTLENQVFQLNLWSRGSNISQNVSSHNFLRIDEQHLQKDSEYQVRARAVPRGTLQGSWSDWSEVYTFVTLPEETWPTGQKWRTATYAAAMSFISAVLILTAISILWKKKIFTCLWPSIPHPKQTLIQICQPNKGLLLNLNPDVFSSLSIYPLQKTPAEEAEPSAGSAASQSGSSQSCDCRSTTSVSTEELEISALLSRSSSDGEDSAAAVPQRADEAKNLRQERGTEEAYVTMSSFYRVQ